MQGLALWEHYTLQALWSLVGVQHRFAVSYHDVMRDPVGLARTTFEQLTKANIQNLRMPTDEYITSFVDSNLHHHRYKNADSNSAALNERSTESAALDLFSRLESDRSLAWITAADNLPTLSPQSKEILEGM